MLIGNDGKTCSSAILEDCVVAQPVRKTLDVTVEMFVLSKDTVLRVLVVTHRAAGAARRARHSRHRWRSAASAPAAGGAAVAGAAG